MSTSKITFEQREKETKALRSFLGWSLISSLALHTTVLLSGFSHLLTEVSQISEEPVEITIIDIPTPEAEKPPELEKVKEKEIEPQTRPSLQTPVASQPLDPVQPQETVVTTTQNPEAQPRKVESVQKETAAIANPIEKPQPQITQVSKAPSQSPSNTTPTTAKVIPNNQSQNTQQSGETLRQVIKESRNSTASPGIVEDSAEGADSPQGSSNNSNLASRLKIDRGVISGTAVGTSGTTSVSSSRNSNIGTTGTSSGSGNANREATARGSQVAVGPTTPKIRERGNSNNLNGRAACRDCATKYPEKARRRGIEGRVEVAVDTDEKGNVTNVRLTRSSGSSDLDEEHLRQARGWKMKPSTTARQGVTIATEYAMQGTRRYRQVQERRRQREVQKAVLTQQETPRRRRRIIASTDVASSSSNSTDAVQSYRRRRSIATGSSSTNQAPTPKRQRLREVIRQRQKRVATSSSPQATTNRQRRERTTSSNREKLRQALKPRRRKRELQTTSQSKLRQTLRRVREQSSSTAPANQ